MTVLTQGQLVAAVQTLRNKWPVTREQLRDWELEAISLMKRIGMHPALSDRTPEIVWHYLIDADIRMKDPRCREMQEQQIDAYLASQLAATDE